VPPSFSSIVAKIVKVVRSNPWPYRSSFSEISEQAPNSDSLGSVPTMLEGVLISLRGTGGRTAVHPAPSVFHRWGLAKAPASRPRSATFGPVHIQVHGVDPLI
jgi:hypothetical protein